MLQSCARQSRLSSSHQQLSIKALIIHRLLQHSLCRQSKPVTWPSLQLNRLQVVAAAQAPFSEMQRDAKGQNESQKRERSQDNNEGQGNSKQKKSKKEKEPNQAGLLVRDIAMAAKHKNLAQALTAYRAAKAGSIQLSTQSFNTVLYLTVGGDFWETLARGGQPHPCALLNISGGQQLPPVMPEVAPAPAPATEQPAADGESKEKKPRNKGVDPDDSGDLLSNTMSKEERVALANEVFETMKQAGCKVDLVTLLALARLEGISGNPDKALEWVRTSKAQGHGVSLRMFQPALVGYSMLHNVQGLQAVHQMLKENDLDLTEYEFSRLLEGYAADPQGAWPLLKGVLGQMTREMEQLTPHTLELLAAYFRSPQSKAALPEAATKAEAPGWKLAVVQVDKQGFSEVSGDKLKVVELEEAEWASFAEGVASLATKNESSNSNFQEYVKWYDRHGPYDILLDGANIAFYGQSKACSFSWPQIIKMWDHVTATHPDKKALLMLHVGRVKNPLAQTPNVQAFLDKLRKSKSFYYTPPGSNDDWYWMYATVKAREKGLLVSNDELRDHIFSLLRPKHFLKWKARHIAHYTFVDRVTPALEYPPAYTSCVQLLDNGAWMFPSTEGDNWLCVKPN